MKQRILFRSIEPHEWVPFTALTHFYPTTQSRCIVACREDGRVMGAVALDNWTPTTVAAHVVILMPRCIGPLWDEVRRFVSEHGIYRLLGTTPSDNIAAMRFRERLGFVEQHRIKDGWGKGADIVISECDIHGWNEHQESAAA